MTAGILAFLIADEQHVGTDGQRRLALADNMLAVRMWHLVGGLVGKASIAERSCTCRVLNSVASKELA